MALPSSNADIDVSWIQFHAITDPANALGRDQRGSGTQEDIQDSLSASRAVEQGIGHQCDRFDRGVEGQEIAFFALS